MKSPIKWTGGKRREIPYFSSYIPQNFDIYIEPFFGGGALYWHLLPQNAIINDINSHLINFYKVLRDNHSSLENILSTFEHNKTFFDKLVNILNNNEFNNNVEQAAIFTILIKLHLVENGELTKAEIIIIHGEIIKNQAIYQSIKAIRNI